jgi:hypothetical protein
VAKYECKSQPGENVRTFLSSYLVIIRVFFTSTSVLLVVLTRNEILVSCSHSFTPSLCGRFDKKASPERAKSHQERHRHAERYMRGERDPPPEEPIDPMEIRVTYLEPAKKPPMKSSTQKDGSGDSPSQAVKGNVPEVNKVRIHVIRTSHTKSQDSLCIRIRANTHTHIRTY